LPATLVLVDRPVAEMLERNLGQPVARTVRVEQVAAQHRVELDAAQGHAMSPEQDGLLLQVVPELADAVVFEERFQPLHHGRQLELVGRLAALSRSPPPSSLSWPTGT
jgi:isochorismate hydrolase